MSRHTEPLYLLNERYKPWKNVSCRATVLR